VHTSKKKANNDNSMNEQSGGLKMKIDKRYSPNSLRKAQPIVEGEIASSYLKSKIRFIVNNFNSGKRSRLWEIRRRAQASTDS
jgi:hypothetical protein